MNREQIEQWHQQARDNLFARKTIIGHQDVLAEFANIVRNAALEEATTMCAGMAVTGEDDDFARGWNSAIDTAINTLKEPKDG